MVVSHGWPPVAQGGAEVYAALLSRSLVRAGIEVVALVREADAERPDGAVRDDVRDGIPIRLVNNTFASARTFSDSYVNPAITDVAVSLAEQMRPDVVHVHHLTCLSTTIVPALAARGIPVVLTLHDYWLMCHRGQLLDPSLDRCDGPGTEGCGRCLGATAGAPGAVLSAARRLVAGLPDAARSASRRAFERGASWLLPADGSREASLQRMRHMLEVCDSVTWFLAPSAHIRTRFVAFGLPAERIRVAEYGTDLTHFAADGHAPRADGPTRFGFLGSLMASKAPHLLLEAHRRLPAGAATVDLYGQHVPYHGDASYERRLATWLTQPGVTFHSAVAHEAVPRVLAALDALVVPSIWEENSPLVVREALAMGVPVVASRIGGIPELIGNGRNGLLFPPGDGAALGHCLEQVIADEDLLVRLRRGIRAPRSLDEATRETVSVYEDATVRPRRGAIIQRSAPPPSAAVSIQMAAVVLNYGRPDETLLAVRALVAGGERLDVIVVDNGDGVALRRVLADLSHDVTLIATGRNLGFSGGCNAGIREALACGVDAVLLINSDVIVPPGTVEALTNALTARPERGIVAPLVMSRAEPGIVASAGMEFSPRSGRMRHRLSGAARAELDVADWTSVDGVNGCAMLIARPVLDRVGLLPEEYFFSFEDLAYCLRARRRGFDVGVTGTAAVFHEGSASIGQRSARRFYFAARNHLRVAEEAQATNRLSRVSRLVSVVTLNLAHAARPDRVPFPTRVTAVFRGTLDYARGRTGDGPD